MRGYNETDPKVRMKEAIRVLEPDRRFFTEVGIVAVVVIAIFLVCII